MGPIFIVLMVLVIPFYILAALLDLIRIAGGATGPDYLMKVIDHAEALIKAIKEKSTP